MATGHTHPVIDGEITTASEFAYECSKSFVWSWRDGNTLAYPPRRDSYYQDALLNAVKELAEWDALDEAGRYERWSAYANEKAAKAEAAEREADENYRRLSNVLSQVEKVDVPETHKNFKEFMIRQLKETMEFDGIFHPDFYRVRDYSEWVDAQRGYILESIERYSKEIREEDARIAESRKWIGTLANLYGLEVKDANEDN